MSNWDERTNAFLKHARGVVHIGANTGQERGIYTSLDLPVIWVEPLDGVFQQLQAAIAEHPTQRAYQYLLTDKDGAEYNFGIANNGGQSSSIFDFHLHKEIWPQVGYVSSVKLKSSTLKAMVEREGIDLSGFDALIMDVQGAELLVLQGAGDLLDRFNWVRCEAADFEIYKDCCQVKDLDAFLLPRGFVKVRTDFGAGKPGLGNALEVLYARKEIADGLGLELGIEERQSANPYAWLASRLENGYSQYGEAGVLKAVFERIGTANKWCADVGAADGILFSNVRGFIEAGWSAALFEADESRFARLTQNSERFINDPIDGQVVRCGQYRVTSMGAFGIETLLAKFDVPRDLDLLTIDVDGQDWHLFNALLEFKPRVAVVEYDPNVEDEFIPAIDDPGQAGLRALLYVGAAKDYVPVCRTQTNVIFVKRELCGLLENQGDTDETGQDQQIKIKAVMSVPRYGSMAARGIIESALRPFGMTVETSQGVFWDQCLQQHVLDARAQGIDWLLTIDFDSTFTAEQVDTMLGILGSHPEIDALVALQARRGKDFPICTIGASVDTEKEITGEPFQVVTAHFGLSLFRLEALERVPLPWFFGMPNIYGHWGDTKPYPEAQPIPWLVEAWKSTGMPDSNPEAELDPDIWFWHQWRKAGNTVYMTPQVRIGHGEELLRVYDEHMQPKIITVQEWRDANKPAKALRTQKVENAL